MNSKKDEAENIYEDIYNAYLDIEAREFKKIQLHNLLELIKCLRKHPRPLIYGLLMICLATVASLMEPRLFGFAIDEAIIPKDWIRLKQLGLLFLFAVIVRVVSVITQAYAFERLGQMVTFDLRMKLFSHLQRLSLSVYDKNPAGRLLTRVTNDISSLNEMFSSGFVAIIGNVMMMVGILVWLMIMNLRLGLIAAGIFPVLAVASVYFSKRLKLAYRDARNKLSVLNAFLAENLLGMKVVQLFNRENLHVNKFARINESYANAQIASIRTFALFQPSITLAAGISMGLVIWYGGNDVRHEHLKIGVLVAYFSYVLSLFQPLREIADRWNIFLSGMASAERIFSILNWPAELLSTEIEESATSLEKIQGHIVFENVWFAYEHENWVLRNFSLEIQPGMRVGVVGYTGAGKTTLISLLLRFYEPQKGRILLDGKDIREYDKRSLRSSFGVIQQDVFLFSGSVEDNIAFWNPDKAKEAQDSLASVGFKDWRKNTPGLRGLEERGSNLSMGERQVLAFARALTVKPKIWILDEATSNIDSQTEILLQHALDSYSINQTTLIVAHRIATVKSADIILVMSKGALVERGHHDELLLADGLYSRLYRYQEAGRGA